MPFDPEYGETLLPDEEKNELTEKARELLGDSVLKADLYDLEQQVQTQVADELVEQILDGALSVSALLNDNFVRELHRRIYGPIWVWGGRQRSRDTNIGVAPERIAVELRTTLDDLNFRWKGSGLLNARSLGVAAHAAVVRIHPFVDGNGRVTRLLADLIFLAAQGEDEVLVYDWNFDRDVYIGLLRDYDQTLDPSALIDFVPVISIEEAL